MIGLGFRSRPRRGGRLLRGRRRPHGPCCRLSLSGERAARLRGRPRPLPGAAGRAAVERTAAQGRAGQGQGADVAGVAGGQVREDEVRHHEELARFAEQHRAAWQVDVEERRRLDKMVDEKERFAAAITSRRSSEFEALKARRCAAAVLQRTPARRGSTEGARLCGRKKCVVLGKTGLPETCGFGWAGRAVPICSVALSAFDVCRTLAGRQGCGKLDVQPESYQHPCQAVLQLADGVGPPACSARATRRWRPSGRSAPWRARCGGARSMYAAAAWSWRSGGARSVAPPAVFTQDRIWG